MKKILTVILIIVALAETNIAFASPELTQVGSGLSDSYEIRSSDNPKIEVENLEKLINNKVDLTKFTKSTSWIISGINDQDSDKGGDDRTCIFCWLFASAFSFWLYHYGKVIKRKRKFKEHWFIKPLIMAVIIYFAHAAVHIHFASTIFLEYYWMLLFDMLVIAYFFYWRIFSKREKRRIKRQQSMARKLVTNN